MTGGRGASENQHRAVSHAIPYVSRDYIVYIHTCVLPLYQQVWQQGNSVRIREGACTERRTDSDVGRKESDPDLGLQKN